MPDRFAHCTFRGARNRSQPRRREAALISLDAAAAQVGLGRVQPGEAG